MNTQVHPQSFTMLLFVMCTVCCVLGATSGKVSRADDMDLQSLANVVQQQAATIQRQDATIQALQTRLEAVEASTQTCVSNLSAVATRVEKRVAFSAHMSPGPVNIGGNSPFVFDIIVTNIGGGYNSHTGIFIAPFDGVYVFQFIVINNGDDPVVHAGIEKDGVVLAVGTSDVEGDGTNSYDDGSALVTTHLTKGDQVYIKRVNYGERVYGNVFCNFSGFLISADS